MEESDPYTKARAFAIRSLSKVAQSTHQLRKKLVQRGFEEEIIERLLKEMIEKGWLDDEAYLRGAVTSRILRYGPRRIEQELLHRGFNRDEVGEALDRVDDSEVKERLEAYVARAAEQGKLNDRKDRERLIRSLVRKGYAFDEILNALEGVKGIENNRWE